MQLDIDAVCCKRSSAGNGRVASKLLGMTRRILIDMNLVKTPAWPFLLLECSGKINTSVSLFLWVQLSPAGAFAIEKQQNQAEGPPLLIRNYLLFPLNLEILKLGRKSIGSPEI